MSREIIWSCVYATPAQQSFIPTDSQLLEIDKAAGIWLRNAKKGGL
jgi:hypothetical protein